MASYFFSATPKKYNLFIFKSVNSEKKYMQADNAIYVYSNVKDFDNNLSTSNVNAFKSQILSNTNISRQCTDAKIIGDQVELWFNGSLTADEEQTLQTIIADKYQDSNIFEVIVDSKGRGQFTSIAEAFESGKVSVFVRDGTYFETRNINIPDGGRLNGESNVRIVLLDGASVRVDGSQGNKQTLGTVSINTLSKSVIGVGTSFTLLSSGDSILLGTIFYEIASIENDSLLTLAETYQGAPLQSAEYLAQHMYKGVKISNLIIGYSAGPGLYIRAVKHCGIDSIGVFSCAPNILVEDSGEFVMQKIINGFSTDVGIVMNNVYAALLHTFNSFNGASDGIVLKGHNANVICSNSSFCNHYGTGLTIKNRAYDLHFIDCVFKNNNLSGIAMYNDIVQIIIQSCTITDNGGHGILLAGSSNVISNCIIKSNANNGVSASLNAIISSNQIKENKEHGIYCDALCNSVGVSMNQIFGNSKDGIHSLSEKGVYSGNNVTENVQNGYHFSGKNNIISSSIISKNVLSGVHFTNTAHENMLSNAQISENSFSGATIESNSNMIAQNLFFNNSNHLTITGSANETIANKLL